MNARNGNTIKLKIQRMSSAILYRRIYIVYLKSYVCVYIYTNMCVRNIDLIE